MAVVLPNIDPTLSSVEAMADRLPAHERALIEWFPATVRTMFVEPLKKASPDRFREVLDERVVDAVRALLRLLANFRTISAVLDPQRLAATVSDPKGHIVIARLIAKYSSP